MLKYAICVPSGDTSLGTRMLVRVSSRRGSPARPVAGSNGISTGLIEPTRDRNARREPSFEKLGRPADAWTPLVTGSGVPDVRPVDASTAMRHRFIEPPRSLAK